MPRITNIEVSQKTNTGNYESFEFKASAVIDESENMEQATAAVTDYVDWHARKPLRDGRRKELLQIVAEGSQAPDTEKEKAAKWLALYDERKARVESM